MPKSRQLPAPPLRARAAKTTVSGKDASITSGFLTVVGIGASAGGLDACRKLVRSLPANNGMSFILVQHLDPNHESMMVDLLIGHTSMVVHQAEDRMVLERNHFYVIPPGTYLSVGEGMLHLSQPAVRHGARMPFDFLLSSLAENYGKRAVCVVLSGAGTDGSAGLKVVKDEGGFVIVQDPKEASYDGMPRNAIMTGVTDLVLPVDEIADALVEHEHMLALDPQGTKSILRERLPDSLPEIIDLLRKQTTHDFTLYKRGTLKRRVERRMMLAGIKNNDMRGYTSILKKDQKELDLLAQDLLINVTAFFRDRSVFDLLEKEIIPDLVLNQASAHPLRVWIAGCSTGEEAYSIAMLFRERIVDEKNNVKLQVFASDVDPDAIATARDGLYSKVIESEVSPARLARFFAKEEHGYRVSPELRAAVVFTVHDVLTDPPFSRLDFVSCRNLLIYFRPEAQAKAISVFQFALRENGILLLGSSETISNIEGRFEVIAKAERLYRHIARDRTRGIGFSLGNNEGMRIPPRLGMSQAPTRQAALADLCKKLVLENYAPAAVLINRKHECLHTIGQIDHYLHVAPGEPSHDLFSMVRPGMATKLRPAIQQALRDKVRVVVAGARMDRKSEDDRFRIELQPAQSEGEDLLLICFIDEPKKGLTKSPQNASVDGPRVVELEQELEGARAELQGAIRDLELSSEDQKAINEEALSVNEEYQSTNEELLTSQEELQSLNEELTALNSQLHETLERQRTTSNDLQNVLYSTDVATLFLDLNLNIRFFTPATRSLFNVIPGDVGRPLADLNSLVDDDKLLNDSRTVVSTLLPIEREVEGQNDVWFIRRILPYRAHDGAIEGVVITFIDITDRKNISKALEAAKQQADLANMAKSRFLAAASHDLRQPLQTLTLLQSLLAKMVVGEVAEKLVDRLDQTLSAMSGMLNTLLDLNQIEAGTVHAEFVTFPINDLLNKLREEFTYIAKAKNLSLRVVPCSLSIYSDPYLLGQMMRNLLSNALKYTDSGKVVVGCRMHKGVLRIKVLDTGVGIPEGELEAIFDEYHQLDNAARERGRGLGLGLSIVRRLGDMLGHPVRVRSRLGKGSVFSVDVTMNPINEKTEPQDVRLTKIEDTTQNIARGGAILVVEDDPEVRELLELLLESEGHQVVSAPDGVVGLELVARGAISPDLLLADYNLPNGMDGLEVATKLRGNLHHEIPVIILTGDISTETLRNITLQSCVQLNKPVKSGELIQTILRLLPASPALSVAPVSPPRTVVNVRPSAATIYVVDDDANIRDSLRSVLEDAGKTVEDFASCEAFLSAYRPGGEICLLIDARLPGMSGLELLEKLNQAGHQLPSIMITGESDVPMAVQAMKVGALDFIEKPVSRENLIKSVNHALELSRDSGKLLAWRQEASDHLTDLTTRERQVMNMVLAGNPSKNIAADLGISQRTVENHRASIMKKTGAKSLPALARLVLTATPNDAGTPSA